ncbi:hypothetical protein [Novosphingobium kaempferiae]|nr:hypothetical protein [Novosphingobium kaempferiae]
MPTNLTQEDADCPAVELFAIDFLMRLAATLVMDCITVIVGKNQIAG